MNRFNYFLFFDYIPFFQWCLDCAKCQRWAIALLLIWLRGASRHGDFSEYRDFFALISSLCCFTHSVLFLQKLYRKLRQCNFMLLGSSIQRWIHYFSSVIHRYGVLFFYFLIVYFTRLNLHTNTHIKNSNIKYTDTDFFTIFLLPDIQSTVVLLIHYCFIYFYTNIIHNTIIWSNR
jgi:hypothetical protein